LGSTAATLRGVGSTRRRKEEEENSQAATTPALKV